jgi:predicted nucleic acid-binding protein
MNVFIDTSTLFKLYKNESGSEIIYDYLKNNEIQTIYLSDITKVEFYSIIWKKVRMKELDFDIAKIILDNFSSDSKYYQFIKIREEVVTKSLKLLEKYYNLGLRSLDSLQISSSIATSVTFDIIITSDKVFFETLELEKINSIYI